MMDRYFGDLEVGGSYDLGTERVTESAIVEFGRRWDPLPQHVDRSAAAGSIPGRLSASGLHTLCLSNRLAVEGFRQDLAPSVGLGFDDVTFSAAVHPGDTVGFTLEVIGKRPSASRPEVGVVTTRIEGAKSDGTEVLAYEPTALVARREAGDG